MSKFFTAFNYSKVLPLPDGFDEPTPDLQLVRPLSVEQQVEQFLAAGRNLEAYRNLGFDFSSGDEIDESLDDPTRDPDFDMIDAAVAERDFLLKMQSVKSKGNSNDKVLNDNENDAETSPAASSVKSSDGSSAAVVKDDNHG